MDNIKKIKILSSLEKIYDSDKMPPAEYKGQKIHNGTSPEPSRNAANINGQNPWLSAVWQFQWSDQKTSMQRLQSCQGRSAHRSFHCTAESSQAVSCS